MGTSLRFLLVHILVALLVASSLFFIPSDTGLYPSAQAAGPTSVSGPISVNTTWTTANSPYIVTGNIQVMTGAHLTVQPGVTVKLNSGLAIQIDGELVARGTEASPIVFTSNLAVPAPGDWSYILFNDTAIDATYDAGFNYVSGSIIEYATVEYAGAVLSGNAGAIWLIGAHPFISKSAIRNNKVSGISATSLTTVLWIDGNVIANNQQSGIYVSGDNSATISNNVVRDNLGSLGAGIYAEGSPNISYNMITGNHSDLSGGGILAPGWAFIVGNTIINNHASDLGGGIYGSAREISTNYIADNQAALGGGIYYEAHLDAQAWITGNRIVRNAASEEGGGIYWAHGPTTSVYYFAGNSILDNTAVKSSAAFLREFSGDFSYNTVIGNTATGPSPSYTLFVHPTSIPYLHHNSVHGNTATYELWNGKPAGPPPVHAENNWWGTSDPTQIQGKIFDSFDNAAYGTVNFTPFLPAHDPMAPPSRPTGLTATPVGAGSVELSWNANPEASVIGYRIYYDTDSVMPYKGAGASEGVSPIDVGNVANFTLNGLGSTDYYVSITAYPQQGAESDYSTQTLVSLGPSIYGTVVYSGTAVGSPDIYILAGVPGLSPYTTTLTTEGGPYTLPSVDDGAYFVQAFLDVDDDVMLSPGDRVAFYDEPVIVSGGPVTGVDISINDTPLGIVLGKIGLQGRENPSGAWMWTDAWVLVDDGIGSYGTMPFPDGTFVISAPAGTYDLYVEMPGYLPATRSGVVFEDLTLTTPDHPPLQLPPILLLGGDTDFDGQVNIVDLMAIAANFGSSVTPGWDGDINGDGLVNILDLVLVGMNFGMTGSPWP